MDDKMKPEDSPNYGVKTANNFPLYVAAFLGAIIVSVIIYGGYHRFETSKKKKEAKNTHVEKTADPKLTIDNLLQSYEKTQKAAKQEAEKPAEAKKDDDKKSSKKQTPEEKLMEQIKQKKLQEFETAISARTTVNSGNWESNAKSNKAVASNSKPSKAEADKWKLNASVEAPESPFMLRAGHFLPAALIGGVNSDLEGNVLAQITENVYDTATHRHLLIPQGTKFFISYDGNVEFGQERLMVVGNRLTFPDGKVLDIGEMPGADIAGYSGFQDKVNHHYLRIYGNALLMSAVIGGTALSQNQNQGQGQNGFGQNSNSILSQSLGQTLGQATTAMLNKNMNISPTIEISPGYNFNVMVTKDITFSSEFASFDY